MSKLTQALDEADSRLRKWHKQNRFPFINTILTLFKNNMNKYPGMLGSSVDATKLALTVKGILVGILPVALIVSKSFGLELDGTELNTIIDAIENLIITVGSVVSLAMTVVGLIRKLIVKFKN